MNLHTEGSVSGERLQRGRSRARLHLRMQHFLRMCMCNCDFAAGSGDLVHMCSGHGCCASREDTADKMCRALLDFAVRVAPPVPSTSKWTKTGPSVDDFMVGHMCRLLHGLTKMATEPFKMDQAGTAAPATSDERPDDDFDWHRVAGKRYLRAMGPLQDSKRSLLVHIFAIVFEPVRVLCLFFLKVSWKPDRSRSPPLLSLLNLDVSQVTAAQQFLSTLLHSGARRLVLIWRFAGNDSLTDFIDKCPDETMRLRRAALLASGGIYRRHQKYLENWRFFAIADDALPLDDRKEVCRDLLQQSFCCLEPGTSSRIARKLQAECPGAHNIEEGVEKLLSMAPLLRQLSWMIKLSIADVEREHAKNKRRVHPQNMIGILAAQSTLGQMSSRQSNFEVMKPGAADSAAPSGAALPHTAASAAPVVHEPERVPRKAQTALQLFHADWLKEERAGRCPKPVGASHWHGARQAVASLTEWRRQNYEERSMASRGEAQLGRAKAKHQRMLAGDASLVALENGQGASSTALAPSFGEGSLDHQDASDYLHTPSMLQPMTAAAAADGGLAQRFAELVPQKHVEDPPPLSRAKTFLETSFANPPVRCALPKLGEQIECHANTIVSDATVCVDHHLPKQVRYLRCCGALCQNSTSP